MRMNTLLPVGLILLIISVNALTFSEYIYVDNKDATGHGGGLLYTQTDSAGAKDMLMGVGRQNYTRILNIDQDKSSLATWYDLDSRLNNSSSQYTDPSIATSSNGSYIKIGGAGRSINAGGTGMSANIGGVGGLYDYSDSNANCIQYNRYSIRMDSLNGLSHFLDIRTKDNIRMGNAVVHDSKTKMVSTKYGIEAGWSDFSEGIAQLDSIKFHPQYLASSTATGRLKMSSSLNDTEIAPIATDQQLLEKKIDAVRLSGEIGHIDFLIPTNDITLENAGNRSNFSVPQGTVSISLPNQPHRFSINSSVTPISAAREQTRPTNVRQLILTARSFPNATFIIPDENKRVDNAPPSSNRPPADPSPSSSNACPTCGGNSAPALDPPSNQSGNSSINQTPGLTLSDESADNMAVVPIGPIDFMWNMTTEIPEPIPCETDYLVLGTTNGTICREPSVVEIGRKTLRSSGYMFRG